MQIRAILVRFLLAAVLSLGGFGQALANRVALVIGNSQYESVSFLPNPVNDSKAMAEALKHQGFDVLQSNNLGREALYDVLRAFRDKADSAEIAMVFYAGHGIEIGGVNYLVPIDADLKDDRDASVEMVTIQTVLAQISGASRLKMVVLDACRDNPFVTKMKRQGAGRNVGRGLAIVDEAGSDTLIAYAAAAGEVTPDGRAGGNSPFTSAILAALASPPADVRQLLGIVRDELRVRVPGSAPFVYSSLGGGQYVINPNSKAKEEPKALPQPKLTDKLGGSGSTLSITRDFAAADRAGDIETWDAFLSAYQNDTGHPLYTLALEKLVRLQRVAVASKMVPVQPAALPEKEIANVNSEGSMRVASFPEDDVTDTTTKMIVASPEVAQQVLVPVKPVVDAPETRLAGLTPVAPVLPAQPRVSQGAALTAPGNDSTSPVAGGSESRLAFDTWDEAARAIQTTLKSQGCYSGAIDGILGRGSASGLRRFSQQAKAQVSASSGSSLAELSATYARLQAHPQVVCPKIKTARRTPTTKRKTSSRQSTGAAAAAGGVTLIVPAKPVTSTVIIDVEGNWSTRKKNK